MDKSKGEIINNLFKVVKKECDLKMDVAGNVECEKRRRIISGLGACLCKAENCQHFRKLVQELSDETDAK